MAAASAEPAAAGRPAVHHPSGLPSPRSPTLSCAEMILPENSLRSFSPSPYIERPPSPPALLYSHSNKSSVTIKLANAPPGRRGGNSPQSQSQAQTLSSKSSRSTIRTMGDSDDSSRSGGSRKSSHSGNRNPPETMLASSPTIADALSSHPPNGIGHYEQERRMSNASSSIHSEDLEKMRWPAFDGPGAFDDSGVVLEEDEDDDESTEKDGSKKDNGEDERWLDEQSDAEDEYSSAALSRRAEMILANAKARLNVMEGNLRGARQSLVVSPTFNKSELPHQLAISRDRDRRLYAGIGPIPPRTRPYHSSPLSVNNSPGHSRGMSETSVPLPFSPTYGRGLPNKRASSAMGVTSGPWSPELHGQGRFPIRESRSFEVVRDPHTPGWEGHNDDREHSLRSYDSRGSKSPPPNTLETLPEDEDGHQLRRSASTAGDLRSQMQDLKGRISSLKQRAKEDNMRRRSLQSLRTESPFTNAESWYGDDVQKAGTSPVTADAGVGTKIESPVRKALFENEDSVEPTAKIVQKGNLKSPKEESYAVRQPALNGTHKSSATLYEDAQDDQFIDEETADYDESAEDLMDDEFVSVDGNEFDQTGSSVYEDAVYEMPVADRHEDRVDAFDYENFFLHSAMGTYSSTSRRSSSGSADSVATTRPVTAVFDPAPKRVSMHQRNSSVDSVSTVATFATAAEEQSDDEDDENAQIDQFSQQIISPPITPHFALQNNLMSPRSDSAINMRKVSPPQLSPPVQFSRGSSPAGDLSRGLQTSKIFSILTESGSQDEPRLALNEEEKQLIYGLAASFQQVCSNLQSTSGDQYERKEWRRRLDEARRVLNGEEFDGSPF